MSVSPGGITWNLNIPPWTSSPNANYAQTVLSGGGQSSSVGRPCEREPWQGYVESEYTGLDARGSVATGSIAWIFNIPAWAAV